MESIRLYHSKSDDITISIDAYFDGEVLVIDGYDIGPRVKEYWGDSDYEYMTRIPATGVNFLYDHFHVEQGNRTALLESLANRYNTSFCYSEIRRLLEDNGIKDEGFTWA